MLIKRIDNGGKKWLCQVPKALPKWHDGTKMTEKYELSFPVSYRKWIHQNSNLNISYQLNNNKQKVFLLT